MNLKFLFTVLVAFTSLQLTAQIQTDRPDQTESSATVNLGDLQIESGILLGFSGEEADRTLVAPTSLFRYGISNAFEFRLVSQFEAQKINDVNIDGMSDLQIGTKIQLLQKENVNTEVAFLSHVVVPSGTSGLSNDKTGTINRVLVTHTINEDLAIGYNVGYDYFGEGDGNLTYTLAFAKSVNDKIGLFIEPYGQYTNFENFELNGNAGFTYLPNDNFQFDFSLGTGITDQMNFLSTGASWLFKRN